MVDNTNASPVHLGFCEPIQDSEHANTIAHQSPNWFEWDGGQVGGRPSWLNPRHLSQSPLYCTNRECTSNNPNTPLRFICQLYAPADTVNLNAFHRTLYVFGCPTCSSVRVLRTQLAEDNAYYPNDAFNDSEWNKHVPQAHQVKICKVCGQRGKGVCPLQDESFCGPFHQKEYKKCVFNVKADTNGDTREEEMTSLPSVYPMYEVVVEEEPRADSNEKDAAAADRETLFESNDDELDEALEQDDLNDMVGAKNRDTKTDATTDAFFVRVGRAKDQCIRYHQWHDESPLWLSSNNVPSTIPDCPCCGAPRKFEFQLMPQLLHYLKRSDENVNGISKQQKEALMAASTIVEKTDPSQMPAEFKETHEKAVQNMQSQLLGNTKELDWGVVAVYTCTASCDTSVADEELGAYREEYAWVQPSLG